MVPLLLFLLVVPFMVLARGGRGLVSAAAAKADGQLGNDRGAGLEGN